MAFSFDSLCALLLLAVTVWGWRKARNLGAGMRVHLRFAAVLLAALSASLMVPVPALALNVALLISGVASAALALSSVNGAPHWLSATVLTLSFAAGLAASLTATPLLALICQGGAGAYILATSFLRGMDDRLLGFAEILGAVSLLLAGLAMADGSPAQATLFLASAFGCV